MKHKQILDNVNLVQEAIHSSKQSDELGMVIKLNMVNDFDRDLHSFLFSIVENLGFCWEFIN